MIQNLSIQVVPLNTTEAYAQIDRAIAVIKNSGLNHTVTSFNTQVEGELKSLLELITEIQSALFNSGTDEVLLNFQIHAKSEMDVFLHEKLKTSKHEF